MRPKVLLIYPPNQLMPSELPRFDGSLSLPYLAGALEDADIEVDILDCTVGTLRHEIKDTFERRVMQDNGLIRVGLSSDDITETIACGGYTVVGVTSIFTPQTRMALEVARAAKAASSDILVIAGGVNARSMPGPFFKAGVDVVCNTEGERIIVEVIRAWQRGDSLAVTGTITLQDGRMIRRNPGPLDTLTDLDGLPMPRWEKLPFTHYDAVSGAAARDSLAKNLRASSSETSRGCPFKCTYCHISVERADEEASGGIGSLRLKSQGRVIAELERLKALGVEKIFLEDDSLLAKKKRIGEIFDHIEGMGLRLADVNGVNLTHFLKRPGVIDDDFLKRLYDAGLTQIVFPVESASQRILNKYATGKLNHKNIDVVELVRKAVKLGMTCPVNMMVGFPDETEEEIAASFELGQRLVDAGAPYVSTYIPIPFLGSSLFDIAIREGYLDRDFNPDLFNWRRAVMKNTTVPPERIEELQQEGWRRINPPDYVARRLSMDIGTRWKSGGPEAAEFHAHAQ